ncbi:hypothetical protein SAMN04515617_12211 [Collimonas sp. OK242]|uniref:HutD/Ves family protein n=1 Tax=Collimonas sp. OK242 TaxID=1798195 RepID=UPI000897C704|nr:HutD family protein [Collimonas sp. OK242]SDY78193.1 hypothetical protein SAMN04515617_12211 [Collimonas sp. OK242]
MKLIKFEDLHATPWKNGGGVTRELYGYPAAASFDAFLWRVSIADVAQSGAFSRFPGVDRVITLLDGEGMQLLADDGKQTALTTPLQPHRFRGEEPIRARLEGGPCQDFNLMLRRGAASGEVEVLRGDRDLPPGWELLFCVQGRWDVRSQGRGQATLAPRQTLVREDEAGALALRALSADSVLISVSINLNINLQPGYQHAAEPS